MRAFELAASQPWLMLPEHLENLLAIAERMGDPQALVTREGERLNKARTVTVRNGVAIVPVTGPIFRYANLFTEISGATSTQVLATDIQRALDDPAVRSIVLNIDSPGGVASGINELAELVYEGRKRKRIVTYAGGYLASAAYWIGSAAQEIVIDETAMAGSIGVIVEAVVQPDGPDKPKRYQVVSRNAPNKRPDVTTEEGRKKIGETVDALAEVFENKVARNLGVAAERIPEMGDYGGLLVGAAAVQAGLAHRLGSLEALITELAKPAATQPRKASMKVVKTTAELREALASGIDPNTIEVASVGTDEIQAARTEAAVAERKRIQGISALASKGFEREVAAAIEAGTSVEATALQLLQAASDRGITLAGIVADSTGASASTPAGDDAASKERGAAVSAIVSGAKRR
ncbi:S49 family peptidase [Pseudomonas aeruginosa]|uniref:S49 family peptidase n=1 Tax=Pseudomonas aeruginosa TaxID=287 RepID=UPI00053ED149|nr:S49 family peptidase [Pseudomonas aeruginosa]EIU1653275.1 S49 family peptidase [Pseudomonas aeruginosa]MBG3977281.1 S49 family peptidase [Pseudomonas aeruginosa]MBG5692076.1 S49 family peptidase [Pseudomonas aeruginosa]MBG5820741.1 S49 family peptidase [Pseudomonas aeruginosa]MCM5664978.1 S49 family peptidase [Pseudomonas aeruginosa]